MFDESSGEYQLSKQNIEKRGVAPTQVHRKSAAKDEGPSCQQDRFLLSVVVPCYNEEAVIELTHRSLVEVLGNQPDFSLELVYVNDGSRDRTEALLDEIAASNEQVRVISFTRNFGHQVAVTAGLEHARGDAVVVIDADLQDPPAVILDMVARWREGYEIVFGVRAKRLKESAFKKLTAAGFYRLFKMLADIDMPLDSADFSLMDRHVVDVLNDLPEKNRFIRGLRAWTGFRQTGVVYERAGRAAGESKYSFSSSLKLALDGIFDFSTKPLSMIFFFGIATSTLSLFGFFFFLAHRLIGFKILGYTSADVPGFTSLILAVFLFGGVQLISVGILGEYLGRIYQEVKLRPTYVVKQGRRGYGKNEGATPEDQEREPAEGSK